MFTSCFSDLRSISMLVLPLTLLGVSWCNAQPASAQMGATVTNPLLDRFDAEAALWWSDPSRKKHNTIHTSYQLAKLAQVGRLRDVPVARVLAALRTAQITDGSDKHGNFMQFPQDGKVTDTNAAFFVGLNLCVLRLAYSDQLTPEELARLDQLGRDMQPWFDAEVSRRSMFYPNKFMGDLVCAWLLSEWLQTPPSETLISTTRDASVYWLQGGWGWAEHLSDLYTRIMCDQIGCVLALAPNLPNDIRRDFEQLRDSLLAIEAAYAGGPRVPSLRSYAFKKKDTPTPYWLRVKNWTTPEEAARSGDDKYGRLFFDKNLTFTPPAPLGEVSNGARFVRVPCLDGETATAWISPTARLGAITRFPLSKDWEQRTWGLAWQSFPVAFADAAEGWGFLRWRTTENGVERPQPAFDRADKSKALISAAPEVLGQTFTRQQGPRLVALRRLSADTHALAALADAFDLIGFSPENLQFTATADGGQRARFTSAGNTWTLGFHPLDSGARAEWITGPDGPRWEARWTADSLKQSPRAAHIWWLAAGEEPAPVISRQATPDAPVSWSFSWPQTIPASPWNLTLQPTAPAHVIE
jgi:hypothetical protein